MSSVSSGLNERSRVELAQGRIEREQEVTLNLGIGRSKVSQRNQAMPAGGIREPRAVPAPPFKAALRVGSSQMGLPRLTDECPGMVGGRSSQTKGGSGSGLWSVGGKEVLKEEERSEEEEETSVAEDKLLLLHWAPFWAETPCRTLGKQRVRTEEKGREGKGAQS